MRNIEYLHSQIVIKPIIYWSDDTVKLLRVVYIIIQYVEMYILLNILHIYV